MNAALVVLPTFLVGFPLLWVAICAFASAGGWGAMARIYPRGDRRPTTEFRFQSLALRAGWLPCNYNGCVALGTGPDGLFLRVVWLLRPFHPPLFVPWAAMTTTARRHWFGSTVELRFPSEPGVVVKLSRATAERLADAVGGFGRSD